MKIEVGKYYRTRNGTKVFGPMKTYDNSGDHSGDYKFRATYEPGVSDFFFTARGCFNCDNEIDIWDLVEEVTNAGVDNPGDAVVPRHDTPACDCGPDGSCPVDLEAAVLEQPAKGLWSRVVHRLAALSRVVRRLYR